MNWAMAMFRVVRLNSPGTIPSVDTAVVVEASDHINLEARVMTLELEVSGLLARIEALERVNEEREAQTKAALERLLGGR